MTPTTNEHELDCIRKHVSAAVTALTKAYDLVADLDDRNASDNEAWACWLDTQLLLADSQVLLARTHAAELSY